LRRSFSLHFVDFQGTGGLPYERDVSFEVLAQKLTREVASLGAEVYILGHSFGGFYAARVALDAPNVKGLVCIDVPFTVRSLQGAGRAYDAVKDPTLKDAELAYLGMPSDLNFARWLSEYGELYFHPSKIEAGRKMLLADEMSAKLFTACRGDAPRLAPILTELSHWRAKRLFIAPEGDVLLSRSHLQAEVEEAGFDYRVVKDAHHFVMFDQPEAVARLIEESFAPEQSKEKK
jgi:pimeloyl-ACP methyl ester carboxylesterase